MEGGSRPRVCKARSRGLHFRGDLARVDEAPKGCQGRGSSCRASPRLRLAKSRSSKPPSPDLYRLRSRDRWLPKLLTFSLLLRVLEPLSPDLCRLRLHDLGEELRRSFHLSRWLSRVA